MRPPRAARPLAVLCLLGAVGGCVSSGSRATHPVAMAGVQTVASRTQDAPPPRDTDPACRQGESRVDERLWSERVARFERHVYRDKAAFRAAKGDLLRDLAAVRGRACNWELRLVDDLVARVQSRTWKSTVERHWRPYYS
jgi:hypothetical protein